MSSHDGRSFVTSKRTSLIDKDDAVDTESFYATTSVHSVRRFFEAHSTFAERQHALGTFVRILPNTEFACNLQLLLLLLVGPVENASKHTKLMRHMVQHAELCLRTMPKLAEKEVAPYERVFARLLVKYCSRPAPVVSAPATPLTPPRLVCAGSESATPKKKRSHKTHKVLRMDTGVVSTQQPVDSSVDALVQATFGLSEPVVTGKGRDEDAVLRLREWITRAYGSPAKGLRMLQKFLENVESSTVQEALKTQPAPRLAGVAELVSSGRQAQFVQVLRRSLTMMELRHTAEPIEPAHYAKTSNMTFWDVERGTPIENGVKDKKHVRVFMTRVGFAEAIKCILTAMGMLVVKKAEELKRAREELPDCAEKRMKV